ncbi:outer membrane protein assembly factor BamA [candidate division KSB1 bacterium]|nr:outer membrane protein assembly factor BamA [candidate division KSB1 bacterium]
MTIVRARNSLALITVIALMGLSLMAAAAFGQDRVKVLGISVEGNSTTDAGLIRAHSGLSIGQEVTGDDIQAAIHQLWKLNLFSDVQILEEREIEAGVYFVVRVKEYPRLEKTDIKGNKKLKGEDFNSLIQLSPGQVVQPKDLVRLKNRLLAKYADKGYLMASVEVNSYTSEATGRQIVSLNIAEGAKVKIQKVSFVGNAAVSSKTLRGKLKGIKRKTLLRSGEFKPEKVDEDKRLIEEFYRSRGFRDAEVVGDSVIYSENRRWLTVVFQVSEGQLYKYGLFTWAGNKLFTTEDLGSRLRVASGDLYNGTKFQQSLADVGNKYYEKGYIYASVTPAEKVREGNLVDVGLEVVEGAEFKVNRVHIEGNTKTKEKVIRRELVLFPGETFDVTKLQRSIREVTILNYFANATPDVQPISDNQVDLYLKVEEKSTDQANASAGYSQRDGFIGSVGFQMNNLFGSGQQFALDWNFGKIYRSFSISFTEPWFRNTKTLVGVSFFDTHRGGSYYGFDEDIVGGTMRVGRRLRWPDDYFRLDYIYRLDRTKYSNFTDAFQISNPRDLQEDVPRISSSLTQIVTRDSRNDPEFPSSGSVNTLETELTGGPLQGDDQYAKAQVTNTWYLPVAGSLTLASTNELGALDGLTRDLHDIPYFDYFFMGGAGLSLGTGLRGYDEREVGPQSGGYAVGGKTMFKQSFELRYPIVRNPTIFVLSFAEAGNVWRSFEETNPTDLKRSVGLGVRLFMPFIGMIGLDYGLGLDYTDARGLRYTDWVPHFQFGRGF